MGLEVDFLTVAEMFERVTAKFAESPRPFYLAKDEGAYRGIVPAELRSMVEQFTRGLAEIGLRRGDRIGLISENRPEWIVADMAMIMLGCVNVPIYTTMTPAQIRYIFEDAGVRVAIVSNRLQLGKVQKITDSVPALEKVIVINPRGVETGGRILSYPEMMERQKAAAPADSGFLRDAAASVAPGDLFTLIYTSGTTGPPKGVMLTHANMASNIRNSAPCLPISRDDVLLSYLPLCHSFERMAGYYTALGCGATVAFASGIESIGENMLEVRPTLMTTVPRLFERIRQKIERQVGEKSVVPRLIFSWSLKAGGKYVRQSQEGKRSLVTAMQKSLADRLALAKVRAATGGRLRFFISGGAPLAPDIGEFFQSIGLTIIEGYGLSESSPVISVNPLSGYRFGSVGKPIPGVEVKIAGDGEILARGPNIMQGYWNQPEATAEAIDREGWLHTGDIGSLDADGFLYITDRKKHLFVSSGGKNIAPQPIENHFLGSRYVDQFILVGDGKNYITALIVPDFESLKEFAARHGISASSDEELVRRPEVVALMKGEIDTHQTDLPNYERVRRFTLLSTPLTVENGELTPTLKVRRKVIAEKYREVIDRMYADD